ncbi:site-specific DNA-methyltransferase [Methanoculleus sp. FWC-SCC3]|uniref:Site-specific DNA-methyltransferase n=1 Tax=Methanoculleus methanifontis TaxID=2584086 RepID=A0ABT8M0W6_9EURY|nr:DNA methyltransferase [Methanoculleus sp. FWC-SCC3]MDN7012659.1 site-specific DNA-methyltransferase [Methanoculleus sp. FWC-SCC3]
MQEEIEKDNVAFGPDETTVPSLKSYLFENVTQVMRSVTFSYAQKATQEFDALFDGHHIFDNPKHYADLSQIVEYLTDENDLILDFFAGTCPTAHAVYNLNLKRETYRNFICIQLQEPVNKKEASGKNALELGYKTIADIGKARIHRVLSNTQNEAQGQQPLLIDRAYRGDFGFRVFKLGESNYRQWKGVDEKDGEAYVDQMSFFTDLLTPGWTPEDVIWEVALKEGYSLSSLIVNLSGITGNQVWRVTDPDRDQSFYICLDDVLKEETVQAMRLNKEDLFVCRDAALTDEMAVNLALQCKLKIL